MVVTTVAVAQNIMYSVIWVLFYSIYQEPHYLPQPFTTPSLQVQSMTQWNPKSLKENPSFSLLARVRHWSRVTHVPLFCSRPWGQKQPGWHIFTQGRGLGNSQVRGQRVPHWLKLMPLGQTGLVGGVTAVMEFSRIKHLEFKNAIKWNDSIGGSGYTSHFFT